MERRLMGHLEPRNCWLPLEEMTVKNDRRYFQNNPQYHMYLHPEMPSYEEQLAARDRMLGKHPNLPFLGAHFGSLEWSVDALARFWRSILRLWWILLRGMGQLSIKVSAIGRKSGTLC